MLMPLTTLVACALALVAPAEDRVERDRLIADLERLSVPRSAYGPPEEREALDAALEFAEGQLRATGLDVERHAFEYRRAFHRDDDRAMWHNVVAERRGAERPHEVLIVGAHIDSVPGSPGADDNASGVAAVLEIARVLAEGPAPAITVRLIVFNLEEIGLIGSKAYASDLRASLRREIEDGGERLVGMLALEMLGYYSDEPGSQRTPIPPIEGVFEPPDAGNFVALVTLAPHAGFNERLRAAMAEAEPEARTFRVDFSALAPPDFYRSDHSPFWVLGAPAVMVTDTSNFRNPHYHTPRDTVETLDLERYELAVRALAGAVERLAGGRR
ncbi:MAG: M20/M25/M40 family metallo-hydrolase [Planctomycetota bacterium]